MKRLSLMLTISLCCTICSAQDLSRFMTERQTKNGTVQVAEAWIIVTAEQLDTLVPVEEELEAWGTETGTVTLRDFTLCVRQLNDTQYAVMLSARQGAGKTYRNGVTTEDALREWITNLAPFGITVDDLKTTQEIKEL